MSFIKLAAYHLQTLGLKRQLTSESKTDEAKQTPGEEKAPAADLPNDTEPSTNNKEQTEDQKIVESITSSPEKSEGNTRHVFQ